MDNHRFSLQTNATGPFHGASQFTINQANMVENYWQQVAATPSLDPVFDILKTEISVGAVHNSGERYDAPKCHPGTREKVLGEIMSWINSENPESRAMWLRGPAGAGKSAIAQTTAEQCFKEGKLLGSFFFARFNSERNRSERLIPTIAYQLATYMPEAKEYLLDVLRAEGPALLKLSVEWQIQRLLVDPIKKVFASTKSPKCVIIDGLDECQDPNKQAEIVRCIIKAAATLATLGYHVSFLIVSRPELEIRQAFGRKEHNTKFIKLDLNKTYDPEKDIDWFLRDKFEHIKSTHPAGQRLDSSWPSNEHIEHIVQKSSGNFIYAATVIRHVQNIRSNPAKSLDEITGIPRASGINNPFAELDQLYTYILQRAVAHSDQIYPKLTSIFEALLYLRYTKHPDLLDEFLGLEGDVEILLGDLYSIVFVPEDRERGEIKFHHASFGDFLKDERRSGNFFINEALAHFRLSNCCVKVLKKFIDSSYDNTYPKAFYPSIREYFHHINKWLQFDSSMEIARSSEMLNNGIAIICHAAVKSKYAAIGIHANEPGGRILGSFSQMIISGSDTSNGESDWIFEEMGKRAGTVLSVGIYLERRAGTWNHIVLEDPNSAGIQFIHDNIVAFFQSPEVNTIMKHAGVRFNIDDVPGLRHIWLEDSESESMTSFVIYPSSSTPAWDQWSFISAKVLVEDGFLFLELNDPCPIRKYKIETSGHHKFGKLRRKIHNLPPKLPCNVYVKAMTLKSAFTMNEYQSSTFRFSLMLSVELLPGLDDSYEVADIANFMNLSQQYAINLSMLNSRIFIGWKAHDLCKLIKYNYSSLKHLELFCIGSNQHDSDVKMLLPAAFMCQTLQTLAFGTFSTANGLPRLAVRATFTRQLASDFRLRIEIKWTLNPDSWDDASWTNEFTVINTPEENTWETNCKWEQNDVIIYGPEVENRARRYGVHIGTGALHGTGSSNTSIFHFNGFHIGAGAFHGTGFSNSNILHVN